MMIIITFNLICQAIFSGNGYTYDVSPNISSAVLQDPDCEKAWYRKAPGDGSELEYLSDGQLHVNQSRHPLVVDVSEKNITITKCVELRHNVTCHGSNQKLRYIYQVTVHNAINSTSSHNAINSTSSPNTINRITIAFSTIIITIIIIVVLICRCRQGRRNRVWRSLRGCCKQTEEQNNNPNHDHAVSADQNGDAVRMSIQDQTSESDKGSRLLSNQNNADCATVNMNGYENDGMKKCTVEDQTAEDDQRWSSVDSRPEFPACPDPAPPYR
ncbi:uncharacterized protein LOC113650434 isoform X2 [Tachysurus fulvidraco]|uniref:uncharacterized protein LOC113650434 isoform X2 n=1 Tax=Tachysurus fulvidraco TaxID=1234273 RepID=UPI001FEDC035|nr:uncharacterized protein LOC113650434 isoform X2 [Tachysurus fulvidraco]XP_047671626.1 uncharacterized protein LOC113650434 isoform X2 [Tachysurus fulvidraco]